MTYINRVFNRSCETMSELPDSSVHCVVTSPPYWGLRDYTGAAGMIGREETLSEHLERLVRVFREVRRVLRPDGTLWLNYGDAYNAGTSAKRPAGNAAIGGWVGSETDGGARLNARGFKRKDLLLMPARLAIALQDDGWWVRSDIIWHKPNPMPSSVTDRPTSSHEYVFLLSKSERYAYDSFGVREPHNPDSDPVGGANSRLYVDRDPAPAHNTGAERERKQQRKQDALGKNTYTGFNSRWKERKANGAPLRHGRDGVTETDIAPRGLGANLRDVWSIATEGYPGEHFAVMPRELVRRCILLGSPADGIVLDPFMGSGTVAEVALGCGRKFVGYEISHEYCALIRDRLGLFGEGVA